MRWVKRAIHAVLRRIGRALLTDVAAEQAALARQMEAALLTMALNRRED